MNVHSISTSPRFRISIPPALRAIYETYGDVLWMLALALIALVYALQYNLVFQAIPHDTTFHIYAAQQMLDGHPIYKDVAIIKAPLADFATALAIWLARLVRISDVMGARLMSLAVAVATTSVTYLAGRVLFRSRIIGVLAGLVMAGWNFYGWRAVTGPEPKAFLILFGMLALVFIAQKRWAPAGAGAALATLSWQPGLLLVAIAMAAALAAPWIEQRNLKRSAAVRQSGMNLLWVVGGFAVPFALVIAYLGANDALGAAWNAMIGANVSHLTTTQARTPLPQMISDNYAEILADGGQYCFSPQEDWLVIGGILGFVIMLGGQLVNAVRRRRLPLNLDRTPLLLYTLGFAAFTLVDFDFCPDIFPLQPVLALMLGWLGWNAARQIGTWVTLRFDASRRFEATHIKLAVSALLAAVLVYVYLLDVIGYHVTGMNFQDQMQVAVAASAYLLPTDHVLSFGDAIVPVTLHLRNSTKILHLGSKSGLGVLASEPGGLQGMIDALDADPPKLVSLSRESFPDWSKPFYEWLERRYEPGEEFPRANVRFFIRKP